MEKDMKKIVSILVGLMCLFGAQLAKAQGIALRTNLVEWGLQAPNIGVDLVLSETSTLSIGVAATAGEMYIRDAFVQSGQIEYRYWFSAQPILWVFREVMTSLVSTTTTSASCSGV